MKNKRATWASRTTFILASIGSAVGLGNAWRFPGLASKHGGGTFLFVYLIALFLMGIPLLMMEVSIARKFHKGAAESMRGICLIAGVISLLYATRAGLAWLDIVDNWTNQINLILIGVLECTVVGWFFDTEKVWREINRNTTRFKMPKAWFLFSVRFFAPAVLSVIFVWNLYHLFIVKGGVYGYAPWAEAIGGWLVSALVFASGFIIRLVIARKKKKGFQETEIVWKDDLP